MKRSCTQSPLTCRGHAIQVFADLSALTIQKRRSLKPLLTVLSQRKIKYRWALLFDLKFDFKGKTHSFRNLHEGKRLLLDLRLVCQEATLDFDESGSSATKTPTPHEPTHECLEQTLQRC